MEILRCEALHKHYGACHALNGVDLSVEKGSFVAVVGASGSGKSTLLHLIGSVERPTSGRVVVDGVDVAALNATRAALFRRRKVGIVYQFYNLMPELRVRTNILLPLLLDRRAPDEVLLRTLNELLGLQDLQERLPAQLSGGQQQRVAIARALIYRPALLLADEPTGNLDRRNAEATIDLLRRAQQTLGQTIVLVTHDARAALAADRVVTLEDGVIVGDERRR